jgi:hypothetical protein
MDQPYGWNEITRMKFNMDKLGTFKVKVVTTREHEDDIDDT